MSEKIFIEVETRNNKYIDKHALIDVIMSEIGGGCMKITLMDKLKQLPEYALVLNKDGGSK